jgi:hypothetical protein
MKKVIALLLVVSAVAFAGKNVAPVQSPIIPVDIASPFYIGAGLTYSFINRDCPCDSSIIRDGRLGPIFRLGWDYNDYLSVESRAIRTGGNSVFSTVSHYGLYLRPRYSFDEDWSIYALLGYGKSKVDYTNGIRSSTTEYTGFNYGFGMEYKLFNDNENNTTSEPSPWSLWIDYQNLISGEGIFNTDANVINTGIRYTF